MILELDCGAVFRFICRGRTGTVFSFENKVMKLHTDHDLGAAEEEFMILLAQHRIPGHLVPAQLPGDIERALDRTLAPKYTVAEHAGKPLYIWKKTAEEADLANVAGIVLDFVVALYDRLDLVHDDIHEANVLVGPDGRVTVCDYGCMGRAGTSRLRDKERAFEAPENTSDVYELTPAADLWRVGRMFEGVFKKGGAHHAMAATIDDLLAPDPHVRMVAARTAILRMHARAAIASPRIISDEPCGVRTGKRGRSPEASSQDSRSELPGPISKAAEFAPQGPVQPKGGELAVMTHP